MDLNDYEDLPDYISTNEVERLSSLILAESSSENKLMTIEKLAILGDHQWHNYVVPSDELRQALSKYLCEFWSDSQEFVEGVIGICYLFSLEKDLYKRALDIYSGEYKQEYIQDYIKSDAEYINPFWSLKKIKGDTTQ